jgi:hypothetical protein
MGAARQVGGVLLRAATVVGIWWTWHVAHADGPPSDDMGGAVTLGVITAVVIFVWGFVDGVRGPFVRAVMAWMHVVLCLGVLIVGLSILEGGALGGLGAFAVLLLAGTLLVVVFAPAVGAAALGAGLRLLTTKLG